MSVYEELADRLRSLAKDEAEQSGASIDRGTVVAANPLIVDLGDDLLLEEGDPDVEFDRAVLASRPAVGDAVRVHCDGRGDYIVSGVIVAGSG